MEGTDTKESFELFGDFVLCKDATEGCDGISGESLFWTDKRNRELTSNNLRTYEVVKLPRVIKGEALLDVSIGDKVISREVGMDVKLGDDEFKIFKIKHLIAKL